MSFSFLFLFLPTFCNTVNNCSHANKGYCCCCSTHYEAALIEDRGILGRSSVVSLN